jgi:hypothetical protein
MVTETWDEDYMAISDESAVKRLKTMRMKSGVARAMFDYLRVYDGHGEATVKPVAIGAGLSEKQVRDLFKTLEKLGLGRLLLGRHTKSTRFEWREQCASLIPGKQRGEPEDEDEETLLARLDIPGASRVATTTWSIELDGPRTRRAALTLPAGVTARDLDKLMAFCERYRKSLTS